jgi:hypothetical protein
MTADVGSTLCNCLGARVAGLDTLLFLPEVLVSSPDAKDQVWKPPREIRVYIKLGFPQPI